MKQLKVWLQNRDYAWKYKLKICLPIFGSLILIDWLTKLAVMKTMDLGSISSFIPGFLRINYVINMGSAYGSNQENPALAISLAAIFTLFILILFIFGNDRKWLIGLSFLGGGSLANLVGRAWSPAIIGLDGEAIHGGVVDFLQWDFSFLGAGNYIFNLADVFVITGIVLIILMLLIDLVKLFRKPKTPKQPPIKTELPLHEEEKREAN